MYDRYAGDAYLSSQLLWEAYTRRIVVHASLGKKQDLISKITRTKGDRSVAQVGEHLSSKHKTLNSNPSTNPPKEICQICPSFF
jgi:hypothetical protein